MRRIAYYTEQLLYTIGRSNSKANNRDDATTMKVSVNKESCILNLISGQSDKIRVILSKGV